MSSLIKCHDESLDELFPAFFVSLYKDGVKINEMDDDEKEKLREKLISWAKDNITNKDVDSYFEDLSYRLCHDDDTNFKNLPETVRKELEKFTIKILYDDEYTDVLEKVLYGYFSSEDYEDDPLTKWKLFRSIFNEGKLNKIINYEFDEAFNYAKREIENSIEYENGEIEVGDFISEKYGIPVVEKLKKDIENQ